MPAFRSLRYWFAGVVASACRSCARLRLRRPLPTPFRAFLDSLWPDAQALGITRATFDTAFKGLTPDLKLPDLILPGRKRDDSAGQAEFTKSAMEYLNPKSLADIGLAGPRVPEAARARDHQHRARDRRRPLHPRRHLGPRDRLRHRAGHARRDPGAGDAGLHRPAQGSVPPGAALRAEDAAGRHPARDAEIFLGGRGRHDAVSAVGLLQVRGRRRWRRQGRHLRLGAGRAGIRRPPARRQGLGSRPALGLRGAASPRTPIARSRDRRGTARSANG